MTPARAALALVLLTAWGASAMAQDRTAQLRAAAASCARRSALVAGIAGVGPAGARVGGRFTTELTAFVGFAYFAVNCWMRAIGTERVTEIILFAGRRRTTTGRPAR